MLPPVGHSPQWHHSIKSLSYTKYIKAKDWKEFDSSFILQFYIDAQTNLRDLDNVRHFNACIRDHKIYFKNNVLLTLNSSALALVAHQMPELLCPSKDAISRSLTSDRTICSSHLHMSANQHKCTDMLYNHCVCNICTFVIILRSH